jgi:hypothetical protein
VELTWNNKIIHIVHLVGYFHSCITIHEFINLKFITQTLLLPEPITCSVPFHHCLT